MEAVRRDAAVARLRVIGSRALIPLTDFIKSEPASAVRSAALSALEGVDDRRVIDIALAALQDVNSDVVVSAVSVLRGWVTREEGTRVLETLTALAVDRRRGARVRAAALDALGDLPRDLVQPILEQAPATSAAPPDDASAMHDWIRAHGHDAPFSTLHDIVIRARERQGAETAARRAQEWLAARGSGHAALARRGSRVAVYDLREAFDAADAPLPLDFLTAVSLVGDASCLEPMARAWAAGGKEKWWRDRLASAAGEIVHRTRLSGRSAVVKRIRAKYAGFV
jgi:hypothetical protein